jgi:hypothetical protein
MDKLDYLRGLLPDLDEAFGRLEEYNTEHDLPKCDYNSCLVTMDKKKHKDHKAKESVF